MLLQPVPTPLRLVGIDDGVTLSIGGELEVAGVQHDLLVRREREGEAAGAGSRDALSSGVAGHLVVVP